MIEIATVVCLIAAPDRCRDLSLTFEVESITPFACMTYGQSELAKWTMEHPGWRIGRFTCRPAGQVAKI